MSCGNITVGVGGRRERRVRSFCLLPLSGSDHERPWVKVLPVSLLCAGLLLWCAFREKTEIDERLEAVFSGRTVDSLDAAQKSNAPLQPRKEK
ncbi:PREDICTED: protein CCSMST1 [Pygoscelis adeliae]|uniref:protein CCSMST1 n=1 Tax=Pygoscelis adeliae TaxID=9238 RepID=UPI0004F4F10C|nr:PREDICTED: protein CCSMST1 [Pygoscelis adeliae]